MIEPNATSFERGIVGSCYQLVRGVAPRWFLARQALWVLLTAALLSGCAVDIAPPIAKVEYQSALEPVEADWKVGEPGQDVEQLPDIELMWYRVDVPESDLWDAAVRVGYTGPLEEVRVDGQTLPTIGTRSVIPLPRRASQVMVRMRPYSGATIPPFRVASQRAIWAASLTREIPEVVAGGVLLLASLILLVATARRSAARAYRGMAVFLGCSGLGAILQAGLLSVVLVPSMTAKFYMHQIIGYLYPFGFVEYAAALFGDGKHRILGRGVRAYGAFVGVVWAAHALGYRDLESWRAVSNGVFLVFAGQAFVLAVRKARLGDRAARAFVGGFGILVLVALPDLLDGMGFFSLPYQTAPYGLLAFGLAMGLVIERRLAETRDALAASTGQLSEKLTILEARNIEVQSLDAELRHQIVERSKQMGSALKAGLVAPASGRALRAGEVVDRRYRIIRPLGHGGMGVVYEVERLEGARRLALKVMSGSSTPTAAARFAREAEIAARLSDPHLVSVVDVSGTDSPTPYLVMELVRGVSLEEMRSRFGDVVWGQRILVQVAAGLCTLHRAAVVHRDLKPGNILLADVPAGARESGEPPSVVARISDFGISRLDQPSAVEGAGGEDSLTEGDGQAGPLGEAGDARSTGALETRDAPSGTHALWPEDTAARLPGASAPEAERHRRAAHETMLLTATGVVMGTPAYMAPELGLGAKRATTGADMFAFGLIAYEVLSGRAAFSEPPIQLARLSRTLPVVAPFPPAVSAGLSSLVIRCLDVSPEHRPTAEEMVSALRVASSASELQ